ncbi:MAG: type III PLP-dependent enzyme [Stackebrandtia sp.]
MRVEDVDIPAYIYDLAEVRRSYERLRAALPQPSTVYYSLKANPHPAVTAALGGLGAHAEVCSSGELEVALAAGIRPDQVLYTGPGKSRRETIVAVEAGVRRFSVDSPRGLDDLDKVAAACGAELECLVRVNDDRPTPGQGLTMTGVASPFGADVGWIEDEPARFADRDGVRVVGLHLYMGSNLVDEAALLAQFAQSIQTAARLEKALDARFSVLDLGGGFGAPYARAGELPVMPHLAERLADMLDEAFGGWRDSAPAVWFESGRYLTATCGRLVTRVLDAKRSNGRSVVVLESGINHLGGMSGLRRLPQITPTLVDAESGEAGEPVSDAMVAGPLCTPLDLWASRTSVPPLEPGQLVEVPNVGAYGLSASLVSFLGHPFPAEVIVDDGRIVETTRLRLLREHVSDNEKE